MPGNHILCLRHDTVFRSNWDRFALIENEEGRRRALRGRRKRAGKPVFENAEVSETV